MTATTTASEARSKAYLLTLLSPGSAIYVDVKMSRSQRSARVRVKIVLTHNLLTVTSAVASVLGLYYLDDQHAAITRPAEAEADDLANRLSVALFGEPGQIKGEYL